MGTSIDEAWRSYFEGRTDAVRALVGNYPQRRSITVDVIDLHGHDETLVEALFDDPDDVLQRGATVLRSAHEELGRLNIRLENVPSQLAPDAIRARHAGTLVTVEGAVESVGPVVAAIAEGVFACRTCGARRRSPVAGLELSSPDRCVECDAAGTLELDREASALVDVQQVTLVGSESDDDGRRMAVWIDDDLVDTVASDERIRATGVMRLDRRGEANRFDFYLDGLAVDEQHPGRPIEEADAPERLKASIRTSWEAVVDR